MDEYQYLTVFVITLAIAEGAGVLLGNLQRLIYQPCLFMAPSSALCQGLHSATMRPLARLE